MPSLYQRMGGDAAVTQAIANFFDEIKQTNELLPFFENISISALQVHQLKLFKVIFGPIEEQPDQEEFLNFMLATHTRLFRDYGLDETHFDLVATCFVKALQSLNAPQDIIDDGCAVLLPLRAVFELGARVAAEEKTYDADYLKRLPTTTAMNIAGSDNYCSADSHEPSTLPDPAWIDTPDWLPEALAKSSNNDTVRAWTCNMIDRFVNDDKVIADTFMDMPYMNHHVYCTAMLQLAFLPEGFDYIDLIPVVKYPRGPQVAPLCAALWKRMVQQFHETAKFMDMDEQVIDKAVRELHSYSYLFPNKEIKMTGGVIAPHVLRKQVIKIDVSALSSSSSSKLLGSSISSKKKKSAYDSDEGTAEDSVFSSATTDDNDNATTTSCTTTGTVKKRRGVWRRLLGWTKA